MYQIMPYSYADSNGDRIGDLLGIVDSLDYIQDMGYEGLWLTPICPAPTYHKYDPTDYYDIDPSFGTLDDYDILVEECHKRGMTILFDLVFNHTALKHPWFDECVDAHAKKDESNPYYEYYNIKEGSAGGAWHTVKGHSDLVYEGQFYDGMPDLNLQAVLDDGEGFLATELKDIMKFWLVDHDIDGFRLDAVTSYFTSDIESNIKFLTWLNDECKALKPNCYLVGEGSWTGNAPENKRYQSSGVDALFNFDNKSPASSVSVPWAIQSKNSSILAKGMQRQWDTAATGIPAQFIANHDTGRLVGPVGGRSKVGAAKLGHSLLQILPGTTYNYYGDEIGMAVPLGGQGDPDIRLHMDWGDSDIETKDPPGAIAYDLEKDKPYPYGSVATQLADPDSLANHVKKANQLRQRFPEIAHGRTELLDTFIPEGTKIKIGAMTKTYGDSTIILVINPSITDGFIYDFSGLGDVTPVAELSVEGETTYSGTELYLAPGAVVVLR